jgi:hypothetical protein
MRWFLLSESTAGAGHESYGGCGHQQFTRVHLQNSFIDARLPSSLGLQQQADVAFVPLVCNADLTWY